jgi:hypothetical protein
MSADADNPVKHRCAYVMICYLAEELRCFGFKVDCPLYRQSAGDSYNQDDFDEAMDQLIKSAKSKHTESEDA